MKSVRLNKENRNQIIANILKKREEVYFKGTAFKNSLDVAKKLEEEDLVAGNLIWDKLFGVLPDKTLLSLLKNNGSSIYFTVGNVSTAKTAFVDKTTGRFGSAGYRTVISGNVTEAYYRACYKKYNKLVALRKGNEEEAYKMKEEITSVIFSINTTAQLVEIWPEVEAFLPEYIANPSKGISLPALVTTSMNKKLGVSCISI